MSNDDRTEDALRRVLSVEAQQVRPAGDGLSRIQQRVESRRARMRWLRPALAGAAAIVVVGGAIGGYAIAKNGNGGNAKVGIAHSSSPAPDVNDQGYPAGAIFPFTTAAQEQAWEQEYQGGHSPWPASPTADTQSWIENYLVEQGPFTYQADTADGASDVTVSRAIGGTDHVVSVVHLVKYGHAWLVTGASDPAGDLTFSSPAADTPVTSPLTVTGPGYGVDEVATVQVRDATTNELFGQANTGSFGNGTAQWSASVPFTATSDSGVVVATVASPADGGLATLSAEKVTFAASGGHVVAASDAYAAEGGSLVKLDPTTGASEGPVDLPGITGSVYEVRQYGDTVYFTVRDGDCLKNLYSLSTNGGSPTVVASGDPDYGIVGFDLSPDGNRLAYFESSGCNQSMAGKGNLVFKQLTGVGSSGEVPFPSEPPALIGDPVWESDNTHVDAFIRTGMGGYLARYNTESERTATPNASACSGYDINSGMPGALTTSADGTLWFATETGTSMQVVSCSNNQPTVEFSTPTNDTPISLSVNASGEVLLVGQGGTVWRWNGTGDPQQLSSATGVTSITW